MTGTFKGNTKLKKVVLWETVSVNKANIPKEAFMNCKSLTDINFPSGLETISLSAFENCTSLTSITIPENFGKSGTTAGFAAKSFKGCTSLKTVIIYETTPPKVVAGPDGSQAFDGNTGETTALPQFYVPDASVAEYKVSKHGMGSNNGFGQNRYKQRIFGISTLPTE